MKLAHLLVVDIMISLRWYDMSLKWEHYPALRRRLRKWAFENTVYLIRSKESDLSLHLILRKMFNE